GAPVSGDGTAAALLAALAVLLVTLWLLAWGEPRLQLSLALLIVAVGVTLGPEVVFIADDLQGSDLERINTVFKFYLQGWTLFALGGAGALAWLWAAAPRWSLAPDPQPDTPGPRGRVERRFGATLLRASVAAPLAILLLASFVYPVVATPIRLAERFDAPPDLGPTLNGYRWMEYGAMPNERCEGVRFADDYAAIRWLNANIVGTPTIAEAAIGPYRGNGSRFANATGLPAVLGWDRHEYQQRPPTGIQTRSTDVRALYNSPEEREKLRVLRRYHISYVVVGAVERHWFYHREGAPPCVPGEAYASARGLAALEGMAGRYLEPVFRSGETTIYRVLPAAFSSGVDAGPRGAAEGPSGAAAPESGGH
ncbi:MAG: DUF2298 domain-containing protein, partial [Chloroflexota bacterium]|nr:DUF2298 domain-containing protein [Chloroflexota bacterium]